MSGSVPAKRSAGLDPRTLARCVRRITWITAVAAGVWFFGQFGTRWVPSDMRTHAELRPGTWCLVDRWSIGLRVGSDVFVRTPLGEMVSRVVALDDEQVVVGHPHPNPNWPDSESFGPLPRAAVLATVVTALRVGEGPDGR